ncbi:centromere/kinetochore protein zw10 homolog [Tribolium castaneum]|uniref:Centromere/kinetochore protein zw10 n=1 Tax=Tribolium castaneum TaxID=7070 RepID=D6WSG2_TRICA|nr:PREDICTED: centromere/kinetochore protein zw10 homolog [Tribolium castaneum]EFA07500.2 zeste-white 10 [Tribolium castaneum]|eukprot:XP_973305.1 PREDICTED: centromere/kinetochore protein zw10 homolog [Tribolium castaneum]
MGSFLAEVLSSVEKMELQQVNTKCPEVAALVEACKAEVVSHLENIYVQFTERPRKNKALAGKITKLEEDINMLRTNLEEITRTELAKSECDIQKHTHALVRAKTEISLVATLFYIHEALMRIVDLQKNRSFFACLEEFQAMEEVFEGLDLEENLAVLQEMQLEFKTERSAFHLTLGNLFKDRVVLQAGGTRSVVKVNNDQQLEDVLCTLYCDNNSVTVLDKVTKFLWDSVFVPIVDTTTEIKVGQEEGFSVLEVITVDPNKKSSYVEVFANIKAVLVFLSDNFDVSLTEDLSTLQYIGRDLRDNLSELIIKRCLQDTIPSTKQGLEDFRRVIEATEDLEKSLFQAKIFAEDTTSILSYACNIDVLFINKKCQEYLASAQELMKKDLHDLVEVGESQTSLDNTQGFPRCGVSRSVTTLLKLMESILVESQTLSQKCAGRLLYTVKNISVLYVTFVPEHHKKLLQTIPQQVALFYNNCMFLAYTLCLWGETHLTKLPSVLEVESSFDREVSQLRAVASDKFASCVKSQIMQIVEIMKESGLGLKQTLEQVDAATEKCLRQCLRQQELLKTVWLKVLPYEVYNRTLGEILNSLCEFLINAVVKFEDISSDAAEQLVELFKMVQTRGPKLFSDAKEVALFVTSWYKVSELAFVLNANLLDINDRWADGKGPLGLQFKAVELKQLVRALFQNTERRAALLERIHD